MKKILFILSLLVTRFSFAQTSIRFGVLAEANYSTLPKGAVGWDAGGLIESSFNNPDSKLRLQLEARYSRINTQTENYKIGAQQIDMPLLAKYFITPFLSINAGPVFNFSLSTQANGLKVYTKSNNDLSNHFEADMVAGVTYYWKHNLFIDFRYSNLFGKYEGSFNQDSFANQFPYKLTNIQIGVGIRFSAINTDFVE